MFSYAIEHMEDDDEDTLPPWVTLEYQHICILAGQSATVYFSNLSKSCADSLSVDLEGHTESTQALPSMVTTTDGVIELMRKHGVPLDKVCLLDPKAEQEISPQDSDTFKWFLFGGILGEDPPRDRTSTLRELGFSTRHLGPVQMTTDTALGVTKIVVDDKVPLSSIDYVDHPTITFNSKVSVEMPFRYIRRDGQPLLPPDMRNIYRSQSFEL